MAPVHAVTDRSREQKLADKIEMEVYRLLQLAGNGREETQRWQSEWGDVIANLRAARSVCRIIQSDGTSEFPSPSSNQQWECARCMAAINLESKELACACGCYWIAPNKASTP